MPRGPERVEGMEKLKRARKRKPDTSQGGPGATSPRFSGGQGVHREVESEGHEEKLCQEDAKASCCTRDEGGPLGTALWGEVSNCHKLLRSKGRGGERYG